MFLPVENVDLLSRYSSGEGEVALDKLGAASWQTRKAGVKKRLRDMAGRLISTARARALSTGAVMISPPGYEEFCARFPFEETEDQAQAMELVAKDLAAGKPMDRLVCGDVGFGKTEIALRAAFIAVMSGSQVAVLAPIAHGFTHFRLDVHPVLVEVGGDGAGAVADAVADPGAMRWVPSGAVADIGLAAPVKRLMEELSRG